MQKEVSKIEFIGSLDFDFIENLPNDGTNCLLFLATLVMKPRSEQFEKLAFAGRHRELNCFSKKNNMFLRSANGKDTW